MGAYVWVVDSGAIMGSGVASASPRVCTPASGAA